MTRGISRRLLLSGLSSLVATRAWGGAPLTSPWPVPREGNVRRVVARPNLSPPSDLIAEAKLGGKVAYVVADGRTGEILEDLNPLLPMAPASVAKAMTATYALETLGSKYRFKTRLIATGPVVNGVVQGDLVLAGSGDPMLDTDDLADMAKALKAAGVREITGKFRVWAGALPYQKVIDPSQPDQVGYNPTISGLNLNYNRVFFEWKRGNGGYSVSLDARSEKYRPEVAIARMRVVERASPVYTYKQDGTVDRWTVSRAALGDGGGRWLPVRRPDLYAGEVFQWLARAHGIALPKVLEARRQPQGTVLAQHESAELTTIVRLMLKYSVNLTAETIGLAASIAQGANPTTLKASAANMNVWLKENLGMRHAKMTDHSGLSDKSRLSASDMVKALLRADGRLHGLMKEVVPLDRDGHKNPRAGHEIHAKTGSLNFVSTLAGYVETEDGHPLIFAIFTGDMKRRASIPREQ
ncbi:MAG TPA: D-alanyl-D-alanine carboxypeptidase/D-alanyl-D-alanine-endopeptidase, partial [Aliiroseovarius sp.]|nr:D-alanyl-D-alanine carboxypeptidase/D-alanyl-D-alanine-endopeptidase [Aliiroseovarius sp.]